MVIICGPTHDQRHVEIELPSSPSKIGVLVSGGIDSAILLYLIYLENQKTGNKHEIIPLTVARKEGSKLFACAVVKQLQLLFNEPFLTPYQVGDNTVFEPQQVTTGMRHAISIGCDVVYLGVIDTLPHHLIGYQKLTVVDSVLYKFPFMNINKSHVIDIVDKFEQHSLSRITHSCDSEIGKCGYCNGCNERAWGFSEMGLIDPGTC